VPGEGFGGLNSYFRIS